MRTCFRILSNSFLPQASPELEASPSPRQQGASCGTDVDGFEVGTRAGGSPFTSGSASAFTRRAGGAWLRAPTVQRGLRRGLSAIPVAVTAAGPAPQLAAPTLCEAVAVWLGAPGPTVARIHVYFLEILVKYVGGKGSATFSVDTGTLTSNLSVKYELDLRVSTSYACLCARVRLG